MREQRRRLGELGVATDERRQLGRQVVRVRVERPQGREARDGRPSAIDLDEMDRRAEVLEPERAEVAQA